MCFMGTVLEVAAYRWKPKTREGHDGHHLRRYQLIVGVAVEAAKRRE